ncbi:MAG: NUDIX domain-containing protein [Candidatus Nanoarchaeia archaeon]|jgi:8-oxo-dGTP pyrophosphatase MutT (NUDIX family)|nr:NUDIX domain-containing protein [Candidatus Nanoarchaeia archaeon]|tara:strand:- start:25308 stop:25745 length:438 start_codon:yes stop_codon:yes gene_type:complete
MEKSLKTFKKVQAIIYDIKDNKPYFLILHRTLRWKGWELLKGTLEKGEEKSLRKALEREIKEETNLKNFKIEKRLNKQIKFYNKQKTAKNIILDVFLVRVNLNQKISLHKNTVIEHDRYKWVNKNTAIKMLTFGNARSLIRNLRL